MEANMTLALRFFICFFLIASAWFIHYQLKEIKQQNKALDEIEQRLSRIIKQLEGG
jgi:hypothetical protein